MNGYRQADPKTTPQLAVPVSLTAHLLDCVKDRPLKHRSRDQAIADLVCTAFYYLLRVGEYTKQPKGRRTVPFRVWDITFRDAQGRIIPSDSPLEVLYTAAEATMRLPNQKNGKKGAIIHNEALLGSEHCPVKCLARRIHHLLSHGGSAASHIFDYYSMHGTLSHISGPQINKAVKEAALGIGLDRHGYLESDVSSHSLRAGGAMAMHLNGIDPLTIQRQGRWESNTFMDYIHEQISAFAAGVSLKMSNNIPFRHIAGPTTTQLPQ